MRPLFSYGFRPFFLRASLFAAVDTLGKPVVVILHMGWALLGVGYLVVALARGWPSLLADTTAQHFFVVYLPIRSSRPADEGAR